MIVKAAKTLLVAVAVLAPVAWFGVSVAPAATHWVPYAREMRRANHEAGLWLLERSYPCADAESELGSAVSGIYTWTDAKGVVHYTDDEGAVPASERGGAELKSLPALRVYRGTYSSVAERARGVARATSMREPASAGTTAIVYSAAWCPACKLTKAHLTRLGVAVDERDIDKDPKAMAELVALAGESPSIPVTVIGSTVIGGFDEERLTAAARAR